ncbi:MAG: polysaccharide biosynthesis/export family protein [Alphaproteobacteria bacterium]|nr:polysaccharide biosynthesis/export family protein [Alphaproteobacteria bacterium]
MNRTSTVPTALLCALLSGLVPATVGCAGRQAKVQSITDAPAEVRRVPTPAEFQIGPGDRISIQVWRHDDLDLDVTVAPDGTISYPLVGRVDVAGKTYTEIRDFLSEAISEYYTDPQVSVNIVELQSQKVIVIGEVAQPMVLQLSNEMSVLEALTRAGGINQYSRTSNVLLIRGGMDSPELYTVDVDAIFSQGDMEQMVFLQRGDIVVVPTRTITNAARFFREVSGVLAPFVAGSAVYRNAVTGGAQGTSSVLE